MLSFPAVPKQARNWGGTGCNSTRVRLTYEKLINGILRHLVLREGLH
jgi:hypothetical protein